MVRGPGNEPDVLNKPRWPHVIDGLPQTHPPRGLPAPPIPQRRRRGQRKPCLPCKEAGDCMSVCPTGLRVTLRFKAGPWGVCRRRETRTLSAPSPPACGAFAEMGDPRTLPAGFASRARALPGHTHQRSSGWRNPWEDTSLSQNMFCSNSQGQLFSKKQSRKDNGCTSLCKKSKRKMS